MCSPSGRPNACGGALLERLGQRVHRGGQLLAGHDVRGPPGVVARGQRTAAGQHGVELRGGPRRARRGRRTPGARRSTAPPRRRTPPARRPAGGPRCAGRRPGRAASADGWRRGRRRPHRGRRPAPARRRPGRRSGRSGSASTRAASGLGPVVGVDHPVEVAAQAQPHLQVAPHRLRRPRSRHARRQPSGHGTGPAASVLVRVRTRRRPGPRSGGSAGASRSRSRGGRRRRLRRGATACRPSRTAAGTPAGPWCPGGPCPGLTGDTEKVPSVPSNTNTRTPPSNGTSRERGEPSNRASDEP